mgnify:CR=1 FL=1
MRCTYQPKIYGDFAGRANGRKCLGFKRAQEFRLEILRHVSYFVQKKCPIMGLFEFSFMRFARPSESAFFVSKQLSFQETMWNRGAINRN